MHGLATCLVVKTINGMIVNHKIVFLFSGQGSHYRGMGEKLYSSYPVFSDSLKKSDELVRQQLGRSLIDELYSVDDKDFDDLLITHPAIVAIELAMLDLMNELGVIPDYVSGTSLGEFAAAVAAGIWTKEMALEAAIEQAKSIVQVGIEGGMLAVINASENALSPLIDRLNLYIASRNFPKHLTFSGQAVDLDTFQLELQRLKIQFLRLPVRSPFHSPMIDAGKAGFIYYAYTAKPLGRPNIPFISGLRAAPLEGSPPDDYFWQVVSKPTDFRSLVAYFEDIGPCLYVDLGPSGTSGNFFKYNLPSRSESIVHPVMTQYRMEEAQLKSLAGLLTTTI